MLVKALVVGYIQTNCYIVTDEETLACAVIDPGAESGVILGYIEEHGLGCRAILFTHGHADHTGALEELWEHTRATVYLSRRDVDFNLGDHHCLTPPENHVYCAEGDEIVVGNLHFFVMETPGHTPGGLTFRCEDCLFTGDTLFYGTCGRVDFPGGDMQAMMTSLRKLAKLDGDFEVYPGHAESTTLEAERRFNPYVIHAMQGT